ncbi:MAG TPA: carboxypeptidase-like regulatory domain-containing protein [Flavisolibacter sp.]|nr:carboxypeptidase-like regulatory domain-containing protein [Flavisolibacter sp.]
MKRFYFIYFLILLAFGGCKDEFEHQDSRDDFKGTEEAKGHVSYKDLYQGDGTELPLAGKKVYLTYSKPDTDTTNYLYYTVTDAQGNFHFSHLYDDKEYILFTRDTIGGVIFSSFTQFTPPGENLNIIATNDAFRQTGIVFIVKDQNEQPLKGARVCVFNNEQLFLGDTCEGSIANVPTDDQGRAVLYNLKGGQYFIKARATAGATLLRGEKTLPYEPKGIIPVEINLSPTTTAKNGIEVVTVDQRGNVLPLSQLCLFNNPDLFRSDSCSKAIQQTPTNSNGAHTFTNLTPGRYYILAQQTFRDSLYRGTGTIDVTTTGVQKLILTLQASPIIRNQLNISVVDVFDDPVYQTQVCVFNSQVLFNADTCLGNIDEKLTDRQGSAQFNNLPQGRYYIRARGQFNNLILKGSAIVDLNGSGTTSTRIVVRQ